VAGPEFYHSQEQRQTQALVLAPQMRQALRILQVAATDLHAEIQEELQKNPTLEELPSETDSISLDAPLSPPALSSGHGDAESHSAENAASALPSPAELDFAKSAESMLPDTASLGSPDSQQPYTGDDAERRQHFFDSLVAPISLRDHLAAQAALADLSPTQQHALDYLIGALDERGFLTQTLEDAALQSGIALSDIAAAVGVLRNFDPPGIGAHTLAECLLLQLRRETIEHGFSGATAADRSDETEASCALAARIIAEQFELLPRSRISELARALGASPEAVQRAIALISRLDTAPGRRFAADSNHIVEPDIEVWRDSLGQWQLTLNRRYIPRLRISATYRDLIAKGRLGNSERDYLREHMRAGRALIDAIEQRQHTLERLARELLARQHAFFEDGPAHLKPLTMTELAARLGVHETTVSRAAANKFIKTPHGLFPLRYFFTTGYQDDSGATVANTSVKEWIADLIASEDRTEPLSDQAIVEKLRERGLHLARRTVTKYRESLGIPPSNIRKCKSP